MKPKGNLIYTIGHSAHDISGFLHLLKLHEVSVVADVRSSPYSRYLPRFNREQLQNDLRAAGISYVFLGAELGARSADPNCYIEGRVQYDRLAQNPQYEKGLDRLASGASSHLIAVMCSEKDPLDCHRTLLVSQSLVARGFQISHILSDGALESHESTLSRLLSQMGLPEQDLFRGRSEILSEALKKQEYRIAYVDKGMRETGGYE